MADSNFIIWVSQTHYWQLDLVPIKNDKDVYINNCTLVNSETKEAIDTIAFKSDYFIPIFQTRSQLGIKEIGKTLLEISKKHNLEMIPSSQMPQDKRKKETKKVSQRRF
jgi:hypothetical protein